MPDNNEIILPLDPQTHSFYRSSVRGPTKRLDMAVITQNWQQNIAETPTSDRYLQLTMCIGNHSVIGAFG